VIGSATLSGTNVATFTTGALPAGTNALSAVFLGGAGVAPSAAAPVLQVVSTTGGGGTGALALTRNLAVGGATNGSVVVYAPNGSGQYVQAATAAPFGNIGTDVRAATADVDGDGVEDTIYVTGPGTPIRVMVLSGANGSVLVAPFDPFGGNFAGGGFVSAADFDKDGRAEFVVSPDQGGGPRVSIFSLLPTGLTLRANYFGIDDPNFRGGARTRAGDINNDGTPDLAVAAGFEGGPRVALYNGTTLLSGAPTKLVNDFFVFESTLRNGAFVTIGDIDGDGIGDLIVGAGPGGGPRVLALSGKTLLDQGIAAAIASPLANFFVNNDDSDRGGVRVVAKNLDNDNKADLVVGTGVGQPSRVRVYHGANITPTGEPTGFQNLEPFGGAALADGVFVG